MDASRRRVRAGLMVLATALSLAAGVVHPAAADEDDRYHQGKFLVAQPSLAAPPFARSVIFMVRHDADGAMGLIVNRPADERPLADLLDGLGMEAPPTDQTDRTIRLHYGGPVEPAIGFFLHSPDYAIEATREVTPWASMTVDTAVLRDIAAGTGPRRFLLALGYAGWAPGQLEQEMAAGSWVVVPADAALLFEPVTDPEHYWRRILERRAIDL